MILLEYDRDINATQDEKYDFVIGVASGKMDFRQIVNRIKENLK